MSSKLLGKRHGGLDRHRGNYGNHGVKGRSGRRPGALRVARDALVANKIAAADAAFAFMEALVHDETAPLVLRSGASQWIWETVHGRPVQRVAEGGADAYREWQARVDQALGIS